MSAESDYAELLDKLADKHQERLQEALFVLEDRIAQLMSEAPTEGGSLFDLEWAIAARPEIRAAMEEVYLSEVDSIIREYVGVADDTAAMLTTYGNFTRLDRATISQLQRLSFQGFEAVANEFIDTIASEVYQSTLTGRAFSDSVKSIRQSINGVYIASDEVEAQRLVDIAQNGTAAESAAAIQQLQTKYARDRVGNNLRKYSTVYAQDSLMQFSASANVAIGKESGADKWKYYGSVIRDSREFCKEHAGKTYTEEEIRDIWQGEWKGKSAGDPFIVRGGYNCRHHFRPVFV